MVILSVVPVHGGDAASIGRSGPDPKAAPPARSDRAARAKAERELEIVALQSLVAPLLATKDGRLFGSGPAGRHWQSMLAEHMARTLAATGQLRLLPRRSPAGSGPGRAQPAPACPSPGCPAPGPWQVEIARHDDTNRAAQR